ncbi:MAG: flagellar protein FlgN [Synergistetes bacterium]|nr:flagellar protein FlgN [Synergistota bacterium]MCX8128196.1 flagellar protein FlgN [Synergistota bacterium]MDW8192572.1 flagellar export chaperone FlgN [Synergistota bacterium]
MQDKERRIIEILEKELELYNMLESLVNEQEKRIEESDIEGLLRVISRKQTIISEQDKLNEELEEVQSGLSGVVERSQDRARLLDFLSKDIREKVEEILDLIKGKVLRILEVENRSREKLSLEIEKVKEALKGLREGKRAIAEYYNSSKVQEPRFIDQRK